LGAQLKTLFVIDCYRNPYAGTEGQLLRLLSGIDRSRFEPELAVFRGSDYLADHDFDVPVQVLGVTRLSSPLNWIRLFRFFCAKRREGFRLVHIFFNDASIICPPILKLLGYRVIISRRDMGYWQNRFNLLPLRLNARYVDRVIVNSRAVRDVTIAREGYPPERIEVIYNGYQPAATPLPNDADAVLAQGDMLKLVLVANIRPLKRIQDAICALGRLRETHPDSMLYIIGDGDHGELADVCARLGLTGHVRFLGPRRDVPALLPVFDIGLLCSESEGFSNTLIEYLQAGLAVICSEVGGNPEIIEHGVTGLLYPVGDVEALAGQLSQLAQDPAARAALGQAGQNRVQQEYSLSRMISRHQHLYTTLAGTT
jgi:glycosyltransferase involved in cell wall biosynthesis